jgi:coenzyme F420-dependent glucose-6-phosphate dehydrogenase
MRFGIKLCSEERSARELVEDAVRAEASGFDLAAISDHYHPWIDVQGESPFVWSALGGVAMATDRLEIGTAVTCPTTRMHPAIVAQAAATAASMMPGRFFLGVGTGERLNEHVTGEPWPRPDRRRAMLQEAVEVMRELWQGDVVVHRGEHYVVDGARIYSVPDTPPPIFVAAAGAASASLAGAIGDGMIGLAPEGELVSTFREGAGADARTYAEISVCWADDPEQGLQTALARWPNVGLPGDLGAELPMPAHFEQAASIVRPDDVRDRVVTGPDPQPYVELVGRYAVAGYDAVWFHQIGVDQAGFAKFFQDELRPALIAA